MHRRATAVLTAVIIAAVAACSAAPTSRPSPFTPGATPRQSIPDVAPTLKALYEAEADRLLWFDGQQPAAPLESTLAAMAAASDHGLDPADYDAQSLATQWTALKAGGGSGPERALFDLAVSVGAARMVKAVHMGRVDPATMLWGYDIAAKQFDLAAAVGEARKPGGLRDALEALQPPFPHYRRARRMAATSFSAPRVQRIAYPRGSR